MNRTRKKEWPWLVTTVVVSAIVAMACWFAFNFVYMKPAEIRADYLTETDDKLNEELVGFRNLLPKISEANEKAKKAQEKVRLLEMQLKTLMDDNKELRAKCDN